MKVEQFKCGVTLYAGDARDGLKCIADNSIDAYVGDPPYALTSVVERFGKSGAAPAHGNGAYVRASRGFMGQQWDTGETAHDPLFWREVWRVLKPGAYLIAMSGTRTYHRLACAIEDAGFDVRDMIAWLYGTGFPKSHDVPKGIDRALGKRGKLGAPKSEAHAGWIDRGRMRGDEGHAGFQRPWMNDADAVDAAARRYIPATIEAAAWDGWGTALKPAFEPCVLARKPLDQDTVGRNVMTWRTGGLNIAACRVPTGETIKATRTVALGSSSGGIYGSAKVPGTYQQQDGGRWPANVVHDGSPEVVAAFPDSDGQRAAVTGREPTANGFSGPVKYSGMRARVPSAPPRGDTGSAARFFYSPKADKGDRAGSDHPTVKPVDLKQYFIRLVCPPGGVVLDTFAGTGTTGEAAAREGVRAILMERERAYIATIKKRFGGRRR